MRVLLHGGAAPRPAACVNPTRTVIETHADTDSGPLVASANRSSWRTSTLPPVATLQHPPTLDALAEVAHAGRTHRALPGAVAVGPALAHDAEHAVPSALSDRLRWAARFRGLLVGHADDLCTLVTRETAKPAWEAFSGDLLPLLAACRWIERRAARVLRPRGVGPAPLWMFGQRHRVERAPLGRVAIIATWNYPLQLLGVQLLHAVVAGNRVVVKPSERSPRSQGLLLDLAHRAGLPRDVLETRGASVEDGRRMLETERFDHIVFTGSTRVGRHIALHAAETLTPTTLELSGSDTALVLDDADAALAARVLFHAAIMNAGQTCMAPRRAFVHERVYARFLAALAPLAAGARPRALIDDAAAAHVWALVERSLAAGARSLSGVAEPPAGRTLRPVVVVDCPADASLASIEHFGPALAVVPCRSVEDMLAAYARIEQKLATSVFTASPARARALAPGLGSSLVTVNDAVLPAAHPGAPIAGRGVSGWGVSRGAEGLLAMTRPVHVSVTPRRLRTPPEPPHPALAARLRGAMLWWYARSAPRPAPAALPQDPAS
jgi:aldehyde dehydrogenase (NAD+)